MLRDMTIIAPVIVTIVAMISSAAAADNVIGLTYFQQLSAASINLTKVLNDTIATGNLQASQIAYAQSRPPYEQIETLASVFADLDADIDARPYAYTDGEAFNSSTDAQMSAKVYKGFHRVESLLFRERNLTAAQWWAADLHNSFLLLTDDLNARDSFPEVATWQGCIALATEVGAKKFASEEETYSDLSILIFHNNFLGIQSQYSAFRDAVNTANPAVGASVDAAFSAAIASVTPYINKPGSLGAVTPYSQVPHAARANIQRTAYGLAAALKNAAAATNVDLSSEEEEEEETCTPTVATATDSEAAIDQALNYFRALMPYQLAAAARLTAAITAANVTAVRAAYTASRPYYEQFEVLAPSFTQEDSDIDAREYAFADGEMSANFKGFHRLERLIFRDNFVDVNATLTYAQGLEMSLAAVSAILNDTSKFTAGSNFAGIIGLATEVPAKKVSSEEETSSDLSHLIFYNNWKGIYSQVAPFLPKVDPSFTAELQAATRAAAACLNVTTADDILVVNASDVTAAFAANLENANYGNYSTVTDTKKQCIVANGYRIRDVIIQIARAANLLDDCHPNHESALKSTSPVLSLASTPVGAPEEAPSPINPLNPPAGSVPPGATAPPPPNLKANMPTASVSLLLGALVAAVALLSAAQLQ